MIAEKDRSGQLMTEMTNGLSALLQLPASETELWSMLSDRSGLCIPVPANLISQLENSLSGSRSAFLRPVEGCHQAANKLSSMILDSPRAYGREMTTTITMSNLLGQTTAILESFSGVNLSLSILLNVTEKQGGSRSSAVILRARPDTLIVHGNSTLMIGEDKDASQLLQAVKDLESYVHEGLGAAQYGSIPVSD